MSSMEASVSISVVLARTGDRISCRLHPESSVSSLRTMISRQAGIAVKDIVLLSSDGRNLSNAPLARYSLHENGAEVFAFARQDLQEDAKLPRFSAPQMPAAQLPDKASAAPPGRNEASLAAKPLMRAFFEYESLAALHLEQSQILQHFIDHAAAFARGEYSAMRAQDRALRAGCANLMDHVGRVREKVDGLRDVVNAQARALDESAKTIEETIAELKQTVIHSKLPNVSEATSLASFIDEEAVHNQIQEGRASVQGMLAKCAEFDDMATSIESSAPQNANVDGVLSLSEAKAIVDTMDEFVSTVHSATEELERDYNDIRGHVDTMIGTAGSSAASLSSSMSSSIAAVSTYDQKHTVNETETLPKLKQIREQAMTFIHQMVELRQKSCKALFERLRAVSALESRIWSFNNHVHLYSGYTEKGESVLESITSLGKMKESYMAALVEVVRRRGFATALRSHVTAMVETLARMRAMETEKREAFSERYSAYLPEGLVPGLGELPSNCEVQISPSDRLLPPIDSITDIRDEIASLPDPLADAVETSREETLTEKQVRALFHRELSEMQEGDRIAALECEVSRLQAELLIRSMSQTSRVGASAVRTERDEQRDTAAVDSDRPSSSAQKAPDADDTLQQLQRTQKQLAALQAALDSAAEQHKADEERILALQQEISSLKAIQQEMSSREDLLRSSWKTSSDSSVPSLKRENEDLRALIAQRSKELLAKSQVIEECQNNAVDLELKYDDSLKRGRELERQVQRLREENKRLSDSSRSGNVDAVKINNLQVGDAAMFIPAATGGGYAVYDHSSPPKYLARDCEETLKGVLRSSDERTNTRPCFIGEIVEMQTRRVAAENERGLSEGSLICEVTAAFHNSLPYALSSSSSSSPSPRSTK